MDITTLNAHRSSVVTDDGTIGFVDVGAGDPVLFVHGVFLNAAVWRNVVDQLGPGYRAIAVDLPCHGATVVTPDHELSLAALADVLDRFCAAMGLDAVDVVANDTGGAVAQMFAVRHRNRVRSLTLTNCDIHDQLPPPAFQPIVDMATAGELAPLAVAMAADHDAARSEAGLGMGYEHPESLTDEVLDAYLLPCAGTVDAARELERFLVSLKSSDLVAIEPELRALDVPTLVVWGNADVFFGMECAAWLRETIPGVREVVEVDGGKLFLPDERAADLVPHLVRHLNAR